ncbi:hypothetical protein NJ76_31070 [Rhodococcus sp. IITR03]|nr:hypothetical protein NJ76_31070 [Rhodococcus sp. IITR03]
MLRAARYPTPPHRTPPRPTHSRRRRHPRRARRFLRSPRKFARADGSRSGRFRPAVRGQRAASNSTSERELLLLPPLELRSVIHTSTCEVWPSASTGIVVSPEASVPEPITCV